MTNLRKKQILLTMENVMLRTILSTLVLLFAFGATAHAAQPCCDDLPCCEDGSPCCDE